MHGAPHRISLILPRWISIRGQTGNPIQSEPPAAGLSNPPLFVVSQQDTVLVSRCTSPSAVPLGLGLVARLSRLIEYQSSYQSSKPWRVTCGMAFSLAVRNGGPEDEAWRSWNRTDATNKQG